MTFCHDLVTLSAVLIRLAPSPPYPPILAPERAATEYRPSAAGDPSVSSVNDGPGRATFPTDHLGLVGDGA
jgi:hypothetical protein